MEVVHIFALNTVLVDFSCDFKPRAKDSVKHFHVMRRDNAYVFGFNEFSSFQDFINHFANQPLLGSDTGINSPVYTEITQTHSAFILHIPLFNSPSTF